MRRPPVRKGQRLLPRLFKKRMNPIRFIAQCLVALQLACACGWAVAKDLDPPALDVKAYLLMDATSGNVLAAYNPDQRLPPASTTKLMTSFLVTEALKAGQLQDTDPVLISEKAWRTGGSRMFVEHGSRVQVIDLLRGIVIDSGNDASVAMAEHMAGSEEAFAVRMNATAAHLGMKNTHFVNATGLPHPNHHASAHDMALLGRAVVLNERADHYALHAERDFTWNNIKQPNRNALLLADATVDGLKTGRTDEAGWCVVATAVRDGVRLIAVVFGATSDRMREAQTQRLLGYGFRAFETSALYPPKAQVGLATVWQGDASSVKAGVADGVFVSHPRGGRDRLEVSTRMRADLQAPIEKGDAVGSLEIRSGGSIIRTVQLVALEDVAQGGWPVRLWDGAHLYVKGLVASLESQWALN